MSTATSKICSKCDTRKRLDLFSKGSGRFGRNTWCKSCMKEYETEYRKKNPDKTAEQNDRRRDYRQEYYRKNKDRIKRSNKDRTLRTNFGIGIDDYERMLEEQEGRCYLCRGSTPDRALAVDHCHTTGVVRGLLCDLCNRGLGMFKDNPGLLRAAADYVEKHQK